MKPFLQAWGRALKYGVLKWNAERRLAHGGAETAPAGVRAAFLVGCGRSGTTVCGDALKNHPRVHYLFEPYHLWATIDPSIDVLNLYHNGTARFLVNADHANEEARRGFNRLFLEPSASAAVMVEKTPFNACRIGYLDYLAPGCKFVHLVRDGVDVAGSIDRLSRDRAYGIAGKPGLNRWWGRGGCKWTALANDGAASGYFPGEVPLLQSYESRGAYEWIVSLREVDRWRSRLGDRLLEMRYEDLTANPRESLQIMAEFLDLKVGPRWLSKAAKRVDKARRNPGIPLVLPPQMAEEFNQLQERFGFSNRALTGKPQTTTMVQMALISNEPTPYRQHVQERLATELVGVHVHNIFTHAISNPGMPWQMSIGTQVDPVFFPMNHLTRHRMVSLRSVRLFHDIRDHILAQDIQMVVVLGYNDLTRLLLMRWGRHHGIPILLAADSNIYGNAKMRRFVRPFKRIFIRWVLKRVSGLMPMGTCGRAYFRQFADHQLPEFLFPHEPDYAALKSPSVGAEQAFRQKHHLDASRRRLLYCGRVIEEKRIDVFLEAFSRVALARPEWDVVIVGDGRAREKLQQSVPEPIRPRVKWLGFLPFEQVVLAYHACDVLVHPSDFEPWGLVINEAVACNLPVIATSVIGAAVELVRHRENGLIVSPRSVEALTEAIWGMTRDDRCVEMRAKSKNVLRWWRRAADPVDGVREALRYFGLLWRQPEGGGGGNELPQASGVSENKGPIIPFAASADSR